MEAWKKTTTCGSFRDAIVLDMIKIVGNIASHGDIYISHNSGTHVHRHPTRQYIYTSVWMNAAVNSEADHLVWQWHHFDTICHRIGWYWHKVKVYEGTLQWTWARTGNRYYTIWFYWTNHSWTKWLQTVAASIQWQNNKLDVRWDHPKTCEHSTKNHRVHTHDGFTCSIEMGKREGSHSQVCICAKDVSIG